MAPLPPKWRGKSCADLERTETARRRAELLASQGCGNVVVVGDGNGALAGALHGHGIDAVRIESKQLRRFEPGRLFDAVAMFDVLEDLPDPLSALERGRTWLPYGGLMAISTASSSGVPARVLGRRFPMVKFPDHMVLFSQDGLTCLLTRVGLSPLRWTSASDVDINNGLGGRILGRALGWIDRAGFGRTFEVLAERVS